MTTTAPITEKTALAVLRAQEWSDRKSLDPYDHKGVPQCPECGGLKEDNDVWRPMFGEYKFIKAGHVTGCSIAKALKRKTW